VLLCCCCMPCYSVFVSQLDQRQAKLSWHVCCKVLLNCRDSWDRRESRQPAQSPHTSCIDQFQHLFKTYKFILAVVSLPFVPCRSCLVWGQAKPAV
jgi:hypothetical protein